MQTLFYPGFDGLACRVLFGMAPSVDNRGADIVLIHTPKLGPVTSLVNSEAARNSLLNRILEIDLSGIRLDLIRLFLLLDDALPDHAQGFEFPIALDFADYKRRGNRVLIERPIPESLLGQMLWRLGIRQRRESVWNKDVLAGSARCFTPHEKCRRLQFEEIKELCQAVGHRPVGQSFPQWLDAQGIVIPFREGSSSTPKPH